MQARETTVLPGWRRQADRKVGLADCSLIVATYCRPVEIVALIDALAKLPDAPGEVVIVDGSPGPETAQALEELGQRGELGFDLLYIDSPSGLTRQRNVGIDASRGEFVFFLDDDCTPEPFYFTAIRRLFIADPSVGGVRGTFTGEPVGPRSTRAWLRSRLGLLPPVQPGEFSATASTLSCSMVPPFSGERAVQVLSGATSAYRRAVLDEHRFSSYFDGYSQGEDLEMSVRVGAHWKLLWSGDARVRHTHAAGGRPRPFVKGRMEVRNRHFIWLRHVPRRRLVDRLRFWADIGFIGACDIAEQVRRPANLMPIAHLCGIIAGAAECLVRPVRYDEPAARREYAFALRILPSEGVA